MWFACNWLVPKTVRHLLDASTDAQYVAELNRAAYAAVSEHLCGLVSAGVSRWEIARATRLSIGCVRSLLTASNDVVTLGTAIALTEGLSLGTMEALLAPTGSNSIAQTAARVHPRLETA